MTPRIPGQFWCPLIFVVTGYAAIFTLGIENNVLPLSIGLAVLLVAPYFIPFRIPDSGIAIWAVRIGMAFAIYGLTRNGDNSSGEVADPHFVFVIGELAAAEMVAQCWRVKPSGNPPGMGLILFAGTAFMGATFISDNTYIPWLTPAFFALLILSWRRIEAQTLTDPLSSWAKVMYVFGIALSIGFGGLTYYTVTFEHDKLNTLFANAPTAPQPGVSNQPVLGYSFDTHNSSERVIELSADPGDPHLRAVAFHVYSVGRWEPSADQRSMINAVNQLGQFSSNSPLVHVRRLAQANGFIFAPLHSSYIDPGVDPEAKWCPREAGPIRIATPAPSEYAFSPETHGYDLIDSAGPNAEFQHDTEVPYTIDPQVVTFTKAVVAKCKTADQKVEAICARLDSDHSYSLNYNPGTGDQVSSFILSKKPSYCEYFASATVIMLRIAGVPARYVVGYYAHEHDSSGGIVVRQRDSHAWAEAYFDGGWQTVDSTPAGGRPDKLYGPVPFWQQYLEAIEDKLDSAQSWIRSGGAITLAIVLAFVVGAYLLIRMALSELRRKTKSKDRARPKQTELSGPAQRFERFLRSQSVSVPVGSTWQEYVSTIEDPPFNQEKAILFVQNYNAVRFGGMNDIELITILDELEASSKEQKKR